MKKIFAVSFLSVLAVGTTTNAWANAGPNLNLATAEYVRGVENRLEDYVLESAVVNSQGKDWRGGDVTTQVEKFPDNYVPTVAHMDAAIANAKPDTSGLVDKAQVIKSDDKALSDGATDLSSTNADQIVPTVGAVEANFVPNVAVDYYNGAMWGNSETLREPGAYLLMVIVDENGNKSYRWVATQIDLYRTSAGEIAG